MQERPHHLYVVEDDAALRDMLTSYLEKQGLAVTAMLGVSTVVMVVLLLRRQGATVPV